MLRVLRSDICENNQPDQQQKLNDFLFGRSLARLLPRK